MDRLTTLLLRLTPSERHEVAREVAARVGSADDVAIEAEWLRALERRFGLAREGGQLTLELSAPQQ